MPSPLQATENKKTIGAESKSVSGRETFERARSRHVMLTRFSTDYSFSRMMGHNWERENEEREVRYVRQDTSVPCFNISCHSLPVEVVCDL